MIQDFLFHCVTWLSLAGTRVHANLSLFSRLNFEVSTLLFLELLVPLCFINEWLSS